MCRFIGIWTKNEPLIFHIEILLLLLGCKARDSEKTEQCDLVTYGYLNNSKTLLYLDIKNDSY